MKIIFTGTEKAILTGAAKMLDITGNGPTKALSVTTNDDGTTTVNVAEEFVSDIAQYFMTTAPIIKFVVTHITNAAEMIGLIADNLGKKWSEVPTSEALTSEEKENQAL